MDIYTGSVPRKFISLRLESAERQDQPPSETTGSTIANQPEARMESTSSWSETSASLSDYFTEVTTKLRETFNLGTSTASSSKTPPKKPAENVQVPLESFPPLIYDIPQFQQEQIPPFYESGPGHLSVQPSARVETPQTTPIKRSEKSKTRKVTVSLSTQETIDRIYSKKSSMVQPSDSDDVFASDHPPNSRISMSQPLRVQQKMT